MMNNILLPRLDAEGTPYISYSQIKLWNEAKSFNLGVAGKQEYMRSYFLGEEYPDKGGFGAFGQDVEDYIANRKGGEKFTDAEKETLDRIEPLGVFQKEFKMQYDGFYMKGFIDDTKPDFSKIRDYKTASEKSKAKYYEDDYNQLDIYALAIKKEHGKLPAEMEVCIIERLGNGFKGGREAMQVGSQIWYVQRETTAKRLQTLENYIFTTVAEISKYYSVFLKLNK